MRAARAAAASSRALAQVRAVCERRSAASVATSAAAHRASEAYALGDIVEIKWRYGGDIVEIQWRYGGSRAPGLRGVRAVEEANPNA